MSKPPSAAAHTRLRLGPAGWRVFCVALAAGALAKGGAFLPIYSIDDFQFLLNEPLFDRMVSDGRPGQAAIMSLFSALGFKSLDAPLLSTTLGLVAFALLGTGLVRHWGIPTRGWLPLAVACLIAVHPYSTEIFTFRMALGTYSIAIVLLALLLLHRRWSRRGILGGALSFALALSIYQSVIHFAVMAALMATAIRLGRLRRGAGGRSFPRLGHRHYGFIASVVLGTGIYLVAAVGAAAVSGRPTSPRTQLLSPVNVGPRLEAAAEVLRYRLWQADPLVAVAVKRLLLALLAAALVSIAVRSRPWGDRRRLAAAVAVVILLACGVAWTLGLSWVLAEFWPVPRTLSHIALLWSAALAIAMVGAPPAARRLLAGVAGLALLAFVGTDNRILSEQQRINRRDAATAIRIVARFETLPNLDKVARLAFVGSLSGYSHAMGTHDMDLNLSAFAAAWSPVPLVLETSGYSWIPIKGPKGRAPAVEYCRGVAPWPGPQSVAVQGDLAIVCLSRPE
jgi:hypothetical protein